MEKKCETQHTCKIRLPLRVAWKIALLALAVCVVGVVGFAIPRWRYCPIAFVEAKEIRRMDGWLFRHSKEELTLLKINDQATIEQILDAMKPISRDWHPAKWQKYGFLKIEFTNGTIVDIEVYDVGEEVAAFSIDRRYFRGGSETKLKDILESEGRRGGRVYHSRSENGANTTDADNHPNESSQPPANAGPRN